MLRWILALGLIGSGSLFAAEPIDDLDYQIALELLKETLSSYEAGGEQVCTCYKPSLAQEAICQDLKKLDEDQLRFCQRTFVDHVTAWLALFADLDQGPHFYWDRDVEEGQEGLKLNRRLFLKSSPLERRAQVMQALIAKEGFLQTGRDLKSPLGPFSSGEELSSVMAKAIALLGFDEAIRMEVKDLWNISRASKRFFIFLDGMRMTHNDEGSRSLLRDPVSQGTSVTFRFRGRRFQFHVGIESLSYEGIFRSQVITEESFSLYKAGIGAYFLPFKGYFSRFSQLNFGVMIQGVTGVSQYRAEEGGIELASQSNVLGYGFLLQGEYPLSYQFWFRIGIALRSLYYEYKNLDLEIEDQSQIIFAGLGYGF